MKISTILIILLWFNELTISQSLSHDSLNLNNITVDIFSSGKYENIRLPNSGNITTLNTGNIWMGGETNGTIKLAADKYSAGDYFYGPAALGNNSGNQTGYNFVWKITQQEILDFQNWYQCTQNPSCTPNSSYSIPAVILNWPAHGDTLVGQSFNLAPYVDYNSNGFYDPNNGDYPCIRGDMSILTLYNDIGIHTSTGGGQIGAEIMAMHYAYDSDPTGSGNDAIFKNVFFSEYSITNTSDTILSDFSIGAWEDGDIGCPDNDYVGCDISRSLTYIYNSTNFDSSNVTTCNYPIGANPPVQGLAILKGLKKNDDLIDNPFTFDIASAVGSEGIPYEYLGCGYGDNIIDNEYLGLTSFMPLGTEIDSITGVETTPAEYYNLLNHTWVNGVALSYGNYGYAQSVYSNYAYPGASDPLYWSTKGLNASPSDWNEEAINSPNGDRKSLSISGPVAFEPGEQLSFTTCHLTARDTNSGNSINSLFNYTDVIHDFYACQENVFVQNCNSQVMSVLDFKETTSVQIFPNPSTGIVNLSNNDSKINIDVHQLTGALICSKNCDNGQIDLTNLSNGTYILRIKHTDKTEIKKIIISK